MLDISTALRYFTTDKTWKRKFGAVFLLSALSCFINIAGTYFAYRSFPGSLESIGFIYGSLLLMMIPNLVLLGYMIDIARNIDSVQKTHLPGWSLGRQFKQGLTIFGSLLIYLVITCVLWILLLSIAVLPLTFGMIV